MNEDVPLDEQDADEEPSDDQFRFKMNKNKGKKKSNLIDEGPDCDKECVGINCQKQCAEALKNEIIVSKEVHLLSKKTKELADMLMSEIENRFEYLVWKQLQNIVNRIRKYSQ